MQVSAVKSRSPSFDRCSSSSTANNSSQMAARLVEEFGDVFAEFCFFKEEEEEEEEEKGGGDEALKSDREEEEEQFEFEFASVSRISADEIFYNGMIRPIYPIVDPNSKYETLHNLGSSNLRKLFVEERETASCSSSEADELDGVAADSYCVWRPKAAAEEGRFWKKSCSIGSGSKRWKLKSILLRSHSLGSKEGEEEISGGAKESSSLRHSGSWKSTFASSPPRRTGDQAAVSQRKLIPPPYKRSDGEKRRPYLPYRQDLVGFLANINVGKKLQPFY